MISWLLYGTFMWWLITASVAVTILVLVEKDGIFGVLATLALYIMFAQWIAGIDIFGNIYHNRLWALVYLTGYFIVGTVWSIFKWWLYLRKELNRYRALKEEGVKDIVKKTGASLEEALKNWKANNYQYRKFSVPEVGDSKRKITSWILYWPFSFLASLFYDLFQEIAHAITEALSKLYEGISTSVFKELREDDAP